MNRPALAAILTALCAPAQAQGLLPERRSGPPSSTEPAPIVISQPVPPNLIVTDEAGVRRTLLSYQAPTEILAVVFLSSRCPSQPSDWTALRRFYKMYGSWQVSFVAVEADARERPAALAGALRKAGLRWPVVENDGGWVSRVLGIQVAPEIALIDESQDLRYRGPLGSPARLKGFQPAQGAWQALSALIGHVDSVADPQPDPGPGCLAR